MTTQTATAAARTDQWIQNIDALHAFVSAHDRAPKQRDSITLDGPGLVNVGRWLHKQFARTDLTPQMAAELHTALAGHPVTREQHWQTHLDALTTYLNVWHETPVNSQVVNGLPLGQWVRDQRKAHQAGRLAADRVTALEAVPGWTWTPFADQFAYALRKYLEFRATHDPDNTGWVPARYVTADGFPLGYWCRWRRRKGATSHPGETARLNAAGFAWTAPPSDERPRVTAEATPEPAPRTMRGVSAYAADNGYTLLTAQP